MSFFNNKSITRFIKIKVKTSSSFAARTRCKYCFSGPLFYFRSGCPVIRRSPSRSGPPSYEKINYNFSKRSIKYRDVAIRDQSFVLDYNKFNVKAHRVKNLNRKINYDDVLYCECTKTHWTFNYNSTKDRKEITSRQSKDFFGGAFTF